MKWLSRTGLAPVLAVGLVGAGCVDLVQAAQYVDRQEKRFNVAGTPDVSLSTFDGSIEVRPWDRPEVVVTLERHARSKEAADALEVQASQSGNQVTVAVRKPRGGGIELGWGNNARVNLIVQMPEAGTLEASSGDGSILVERITGRCDLRSGDGSIVAHDLTGGVKAHTGDGSITLTNASGAVDVDSGDGSVAVDGRLTGVRVRTGDGSVKVQASAGSATTDDWDIVTGDGSVALALPDGFSGTLDAHTGDGRVELNGIAVTGVTGEISKKSVRGTLGAGGRQVRVRTGDGSITLRRY
ncbi:MAG: DUF4097 family beta strand repeat-containing protein [Betaproteobacteria bacterium]